MGGEGSMDGMRISFKNNRNLLREKKPFKRVSEYIGYTHIDSHDTKHLSEAELMTLKLKYRKIRAYNRKVSIIIIGILLLVLIAILLLINL